jgi:hypothetical protein
VIHIGIHIQVVSTQHYLDTDLNPHLDKWCSVNGAYVKRIMALHDDKHTCLSGAVASKTRL